jgi:hypothetical protein
MERRDYCHCSQTKARRADPGQTTQSPMHVPQKYRVRLGFLGVLKNPVRTMQLSMNVASAQVQMQVPMLVVRGRLETHDAGQKGSGCSAQHERVCLPLWSIVGHLGLVSEVSVLGILNVPVNWAAEVVVLMAKVLK